MSRESRARSEGPCGAPHHRAPRPTDILRGSAGRPASLMPPRPDTFRGWTSIPLRRVRGAMVFCWEGSTVNHFVTVFVFFTRSAKSIGQFHFITCPASRMVVERLPRGFKRQKRLFVLFPPIQFFWDVYHQVWPARIFRRVFLGNFPNR